MMKFGIKDPSKAFLLNNTTESWLFLIGQGCDISIKKQPNKYQSYCENQNFDYGNINDALRGTSDYYTPKRFVVIQMK